MSAPPASEELASNRPASRRTFGLGFLQPEEEPPGTPQSSATIPSPTPSPEASPGGELDGELASEFDEMPDEKTASPADTSSRGSTRGSNPVREGLRDMARNGVILASEQVHTYLGARTAGMRQVDLYRADEEDAERIGDPLARIASRRDGVGEMSEDATDLMAALMGLAGYATKQVQRKAVAAKIDARELDVPAAAPVDL